MKTILLLGLFLAVTTAADDKLLPIVPNGVSPNGKFQIGVLDNKEGPLSYAAVDSRSKKILAKIPSSYHESGSYRSWALDQTLAADIHWHPGNSLVVIDEHSHRYIGTVHILAIYAEGNVSEIPLPAISEMTPGVPWDRFRIRVERPGWIGDKDSLLLVGGKVVIKDEPRTMEWRSYDVLLEISERAKVKSIKRMEH